MNAKEKPQSPVTRGKGSKKKVSADRSKHSYKNQNNRSTGRLDTVRRKALALLERHVSLPPSVFLSVIRCTLGELYESIWPELRSGEVAFLENSYLRIMPKPACEVRQ